MKKIILTIVMFLIFINIVSAAFVISLDMIKERYGFEFKFIEDPEGSTYDVNGETKRGAYYIFIDEDNSCEYIEFVYGGCGKEYLTNLPCVPLNENVWEFEHCCGNAEPYLKSGMVGQSRCQIVNKKEKFLDQTENIIKPRFMLSTLKDNTLTWAIVIIILAIIIYFIKKKKK